MKTFILTLTAFVSIFVTSEARACAGCIDIFTEVIPFNIQVSKELSRQLKIKAGGEEMIGGMTLACSKKGFFAEGVNDCKISNYDGSVPFKIEGDLAIAMLKKLAGFKAEMMTSTEDDDGPAPRTGKKGYVGSRVISGEEYRFTLQPHYALIKCASASRCALEVRTLSIMDLPVSLQD